MKLFGNSKYDWNLYTEPQKYMGNRRMFWPRGKTLGGSSSINAMIYQRGNAEDYNEWENRLGLVGWGYKHMLKFFKKTTMQSNENLDHEYHGYDGRWRISNPIHPHELSLAIIESIHKNQGLPINHDANGKQQIGVGLNQVNIDKVGRRHSLSDAFLDNETLQRKNLFVRLHAHVSRVLFDENTKTAIGVEYVDTLTNETFTAYASKEVILAAGAVHSPHILMLSGIGPQEVLEKFNISVLKHSPGVGQNLLDHLQTGAMFRLKKEYRHLSLEEEQGPVQVFQWLLSGSGPLTSNGGEVNGYFASKYSEHPDLPDLQYLGIPGFYVDHARRESRLKHPEGSFCLQVVLLRPKSVGYITINSSNPFDPPVIQPNYLKEEVDRLTLIEGLKWIRIVVNSEPFARYIEKELYPGENVTTTEQLSESINQLAETLYHPVGTCKMGLENDPMAVVNERLEVRGVKNLRIVDASIMPTIPRGNTNAPVAAIAEKAYEDFIKEDHFLSY
jgi:choline dehydrogenase